MKLLKNSTLLACGLVLCAMPQTTLAKGVTPKPGENPDISYTVSFGKELSKTPAKRTITIPNVGEFRVLKGDFHIHTLFSDGRVWPTQRVIEADGNGLDVIAITDHIEYRPFVGGVPRKNKAGKVTNFPLLNGTEDYNLSYEIAKVEAGKRKLLLVRGTEITKSKMPPGHVNALFVTDVNKIAAKQNDFREMFKEAVAQGGFLLWNHPGWEAPKSGGIANGAPTIFTDVHKEMYEKGWMHGIEAFNGKQFYPVVAKWCTDKNLAVFANSDIHPPEFDMYGVRNPLRPITLVLAKEKTLESVREAFFAKRTIGWAANMVFGQEKWVRQLFEACVEIKKESGNLIFVNRSSIPAKIKVGEKTVQLDPMSNATAQSGATAKTITVENWMVGKYKPLIVPVN
ncbi:putative metal-dependent phosphoesterase TrpH [Ereboglobus sp. PH5-5]|uniref:hypothetical protein n=1 Tax=Ereboglobus sp. PH5-5 TaxID=2940529 RepID=UPI002406C068|nr:hypothetical protein [Ereboglobus sp. PH5-5]MDF9831928.1 putative metal-dependent phosphoesterase TrpH [Ereboglobus sp. PH5-5]